MALRAVPDHPKFADLKARLGVPKHVALGILETLWHFAGRYTPQGNIGKYEDSAIEAWLEWDGAQTGDLIKALVDSKWLDRDSRWRVLVHDWPTHADKATKQALNRAKLEFCVPTVHTPGVHNSVLSSLPVPEPVPVPVPEPGPRNSARTPPDDTETQLRKIADDCPNQQDYQFGVDLAVQHVLSSANPETTLRAMTDNLPLWWAAMREGRARAKSMRYVIVDLDYLRVPNPIPNGKPPRKRTPNYRMGEME